MSAPPIRALVVDDDALARQRIRALLAECPDVAVIGECADGREAVAALLRTPVDLLVLDVQMPGLDGFGVITELRAERLPLVIFVSAYSEYAIRAFEAYALDYLLKPFDDARFAAALDRARAQLRAQRHEAAVSATNGSAPAASGLDPRISALLDHLDRRPLSHYPESMAIRNGDRFVVLRVADIDWIEADGSYARLHVRGRTRLLTRTLATLEQEVLDPTRFVRVHRSVIVNTARIVSAEPHVHGELTLVLSDGSRVPCSRRQRATLEERLYFTS